MTDIDALIAEVQCLSVYHQHWPYYSRLLDALTTERAKVAALEAEVERLGEDSCEWADLFIAAKAEATRWREVAGECAGAWEKIDDWFPDGNAARAALARYKQESGQ